MKTETSLHEQTAAAIRTLAVRLVPQPLDRDRLAKINEVHNKFLASKPTIQALKDMATELLAATDGGSR